jgi:hypothetical protein
MRRRTLSEVFRLRDSLIGDLKLCDIDTVDDVNNRRKVVGVRRRLPQSHPTGCG